MRWLADGDRAEDGWQPMDSRQRRTPHLGRSDRARTRSGSRRSASVRRLRSGPPPGRQVARNVDTRASRSSRHPCEIGTSAEQQSCVRPDQLDDGTAWNISAQLSEVIECPPHSSQFGQVEFAEPAQIQPDGAASADDLLLQPLGDGEEVFMPLPFALFRPRSTSSAASHEIARASPDRDLCEVCSRLELFCDLGSRLYPHEVHSLRNSSHWHTSIRGEEQLVAHRSSSSRSTGQPDPGATLHPPASSPPSWNHRPRKMSTIWSCPSPQWDSRRRRIRSGRPRR